MFNLNTLEKTKFKTPKRIGRGGNRGKNSGSGNKGQVKRAGKSRIGFEGGQRSSVRRLPKFKGYNFNPKIKKDEVSINLSLLEKFFSSTDLISIDSLKTKSIISNKVVRVRILMNKNQKNKLQFNTNDINSFYFTKGAKEFLGV